MRGVISFLLVLLFVFPLLQITELQRQVAETNAFYENKVLFLEKRYYVDSDLKNAFRQVFASAQRRGGERQEVALDAAKKLVLLEEFVEESYAEKGVLVDVWFGVTDAGEIHAVRKKMLEEKKPVKCSTCRDLNAMAVSWEEEIVPQTMGFLDVDLLTNEVRVSRNGLAFVPDVATAFQLLPGEFGFGASIYFPEADAATVILLPEGFHAKYASV